MRGECVRKGEWDERKVYRRIGDRDERTQRTVYKRIGEWDDRKEIVNEWC
jgi:hypothetical protein